MNERAFETVAERRVALAHEFGHCRTGAFCTERNYTINYGRAENRAWTSTVFNELPVDDLWDAVQRAGGNLFEAAEELNFTQEFVERAIGVYRLKGLWD
ncbi:hypothetical protein FACS1894202_03760 [Clostridia bacterium]|nr:hypothetical protein FACS1894202_03760 [Clostridia bacterium]